MPNHLSKAVKVPYWVRRNTVKFRKYEPPCISSPEYNPQILNEKGTPIISPLGPERTRPLAQTGLLAFYCDDVTNWEVDFGIPL